MGFIIYFSFDVDVDLGPLPQKKSFGLRKTSRMELPINSSKSKLTIRKFLLHFFIVVRPHFMWVVVCLALVAYTKLSPNWVMVSKNSHFLCFLYILVLAFLTLFLFETGISVEISLFRLIFVETLQRLCDFVQ